MSETLAERFWSKVEKTDTCWLWTHAQTTEGYGQFGINYEAFLAHRVSWVLAGNKLLESMEVLHHCDNKMCVRPDHLFLGTQQDNMSDMINKNRQHHSDQHGEKNHHSKLTESQVIEIRTLYQSGKFSQSYLGTLYNVGQTIIGRIVRNTAWQTANIKDSH